MLGNGEKLFGQVSEKKTVVSTLYQQAKNVDFTLKLCYLMSIRDCSEFLVGGGGGSFRKRCT